MLGRALICLAVPHPGNANERGANVIQPRRARFSGTSRIVILLAVLQFTSVCNGGYDKCLLASAYRVLRGDPVSPLRARPLVRARS